MALKSNGVTQVPDGLGSADQVLKVNSAGTAGEWGTITSSDLTEGSTNLFFTDARADARVALLVDSAPSTLDTLNELAAALGDDANFSTTVTNSIATKLPLAGGTITGNINFGNHDKAIFGINSNLQIFSDDTNSFIQESHPVGNLYIKTESFNVGRHANTELYITAFSEGAVNLYHDNAKKLETTSTGIDVTGVITTDSMTTSGNVGIGTATPTAKLQIGDNWTINSSYGSSNLYIKQSSLIADGDPRIISTSDIGLIISKNSTNTSGPTEVGLVLHNDDTTAGAFSPMLLFTKRESAPSPYKATMAGIWAKSPTGTGAGGAWIDGELHFGTAGNGTLGVVSNMVINKEGNVGIGTTAPYSTLQVGDPEDTTAALLTIASRYNGGGGPVLNFRSGHGSNSSVWDMGRILVTDDGNYNGKIHFQTGVGGQQAPTTKMTIKANGYVGIGTSSPAGPLEINTGTGVNILGNTVVITRPAASDYSAITFRTGSTADWSIGQNSVGGFGIWENGSGASNRFIIKDGGNVGIGTTTPTGRTEIVDNGSVNDRLLYLNSSGGLSGGQTGPLYGLYSDIYSNNNAPSAYGGYFNSYCPGGDTYGVFSEASQLSSSRDSIAIYGKATVNSGSVYHRSNRAIGSGPVAGVYATVETTGTSMAAETTALHALNSTVYGAEAYGAWIETTAGPTTVVPLKVVHANSEIFRIDASGNVGIGTTNPTVAAGTGLVINGGTNQARLALKNDATGDGSGDGFQIVVTSGSGSNGGQAILEQRENNIIAFKTNSSEAMRILPSGNVGIGEVNPLHPLHVDGTIYSTNNIQLNSTKQVLFGNGNQYIKGTNDTSIEIGTGGTATITATHAGDVEISGALKLSATAVLDNATTTTTTVSQTAIDQWSASTYGGGKIIIEAKAGAERQITELLVTHNGTTASAVEYGAVFTGGKLATYDVDISGGNVRILVVASSTTSTSYKVVRTTMFA